MTISKEHKKTLTTLFYLASLCILNQIETPIVLDVLQLEFKHYPIDFLLEQLEIYLVNKKEYLSIEQQQKLKNFLINIDSDIINIRHL